MHDELLNAALRYAELGYRIFPCVPGGKAPLTDHGFHDATTSAEQIERWWSLHQLANIGIATKGLLVVDIDGTDNPWPGDPERAADLAGAVAIAVTPRGGRHYYYRQPAGRNWRCTTSRLASHVDTRAAGGYVLVPPSRTQDGEYRWVEGLAMDVMPDRLSEPPPWLIAELDRLAEPSNGQAKASAESQQAKASSEASNGIEDGTRNDTLFKIACSMRRRGLGETEIFKALATINETACRPPLEEKEVRRIAQSAAEYEPEQNAKTPQIAPVCLNDLVARYPDLRLPVIHGLLRQGETMNLISAPKIGKSWLVTDLALAVATGRPWLETFATEPGNVLIIDNELHGETSANRIPKVAAARQISLAEVGDRVFVQNLRGQWYDIFSLGAYFSSLEPRRFKVIILDAMYRLMPRNMDENDNGTMSSVYNAIDRYADQLGCCFVLVHHSSKGNQAGKAITDVGAGAGAQARATDTHVVLRPHEEDDVVVLEAAVRSWSPVPARCLRWTFPVWTLADDLDPTLLRCSNSQRKGKPIAHDPQEEWTPERFVQECMADHPETRAIILERAEKLGLSNRRSVLLLQRAESAGLIHRWQSGRGKPVVYAPKLEDPLG